MAATDELAGTRRAFLDLVLQSLPVEPYTDRVADRHAQLLAHVRREGTTRGAHDLIIAATALSTGRTVLTADGNAEFDPLPGVPSRLVRV